MSDESPPVPDSNSSSIPNRVNAWPILRHGLIMTASCALVGALSGWIGWDFGKRGSFDAGPTGKAIAFVLEKVAVPVIEMPRLLMGLDLEYGWGAAGYAIGILAGLFVGIPRRRPISWATLGAVIGTLNMVVFHLLSQSGRIDLEASSLIACASVSAVIGGIVCTVDRWKRMRQVGPSVTASGGKASQPSSLEPSITARS